MQQNYITVRQAAEYASVAQITVRTWLNKRWIPKVKLGRAVRIPLNSFQQFIEQRTVPALSR